MAKPFSKEADPMGDRDAWLGAPLEMLRVLRVAFPDLDDEAVRRILHLPTLDVNDSPDNEFKC